MSQQQQQVVRRPQHDALIERRKAIETFLADKSAMLKTVSATVNPQKLIRYGLGLSARNPRLLECSPQSWLFALMDSAYYGLEPNPALGLAYLVPYRNKDKGFEVQFQIGYKGLIALATQAGGISHIQPRLVREGDEFDVRYDLEWQGKAPFVHRPNMSGEEREVTHVYALTTFPSRAMSFHYMSREQIEAHRAKFSKNTTDDSPWKTNWEQMAQKTVIRAALKTVALAGANAGKVARALQQDSAQSAGFNIRAIQMDDADDAEAPEEELAE